MAEEEKSNNTTKDGSPSSYASVNEGDPQSLEKEQQEPQPPQNDNNNIDNNTYEPSRQVGIRLEDTLAQLTDKLKELDMTFQKKFDDMSKQMDRLEKSLIELSE